MMDIMAANAIKRVPAQHSFKERLEAAVVVLRHISYGGYGALVAQQDMAWALSVMAEGIYRGLPE